jgi:hypothetical protein
MFRHLRRAEKENYSDGSFSPLRGNTFMIHACQEYLNDVRKAVQVLED